MEYRYYQKEAIAAAIANDNGVLALPTGAGKSHVSKGIIQSYPNERILILQPSAEILKSNISRLHDTGMLDATAYSASYGEKKMSRVVFATIGSIIKKKEMFQKFKHLYIDECHLVNSSKGMYNDLISYLTPEKLIGMSATPYRQHSNSLGTETRMITRTKPKILKSIIYNINPSELISKGYLVNPEFHQIETDDSFLVVNSTGKDFTKESIQLFIENNEMHKKAADVVKSIKDNFSSILIFADSVKTSKEITKILSLDGIKSAEVNALTKKKDRKEIIDLFNKNEIQVVSNVGTLTTGFDKPNLECIIDARPIRSPALHYQKIGRVVRPYEGKKAIVIDLAGNLERLGNPLDYEIRETFKGYHDLYCGDKQITPIRKNQSAGSHYVKKINRYTPMFFGKHKGTKLKDIPVDYMRWYLTTTNQNKDLSKVFKEEVEVQEDLLKNSFNGYTTHI